MLFSPLPLGVRSESYIFSKDLSPSALQRIAF